MTIMQNRIGDLTPYTPIRIGPGARTPSIELNLATMSNPHMLMLGMSGSGKSHTIRNIAANLFARGLTVHIIELHPDMSYEDFVASGCGHLVSPSDFNYMNYHYVEGDASVNPLAFNPIADSGGVYMAIQDFLEVVKLFNPALGPRQISYLQKLAEYTYERKNIHHDRPETWVRDGDPKDTSHHPSIIDLMDSLKEIRRAVASGLAESVFKEIERLRHGCMKLKRRIDAGTMDEDESAKKKDELDGKFVQLCDKVNDMVKDEIFSGMGQDKFYQGWKTDTLDSLADTLRSMIESTLFTRGLDDPASATRPQKGKINVYRLSNLAYAHQKTMIHILLTRIYNASMRMCRQMNPPVPDTYLVLDEGRYAKEAAKNPMSPMNVIMGGSRKFGLGSIIGVQGPDQLSTDMATNFAAKFILNCAEASYADAKKYFGIPPSRMKTITARQDALVSLNPQPFELTRLFPKESV